MCKRRQSTCLLVYLAIATLAAADATAGDFKQAKALCDQEKWMEAIPLLAGITDEHPAHDPARILLATAYEKGDRIEDAISTWKDVLAVSRIEENRSTARKAVARLRRILLDARLQDDIYADPPEDELYIAVPEPDWSKIINDDDMPIVQDSKYIRIPEHQAEVPPMVYRTAHFDVYSTSEDLSKLIGDRAEIFLDFVSKIVLDGEAWAVRFPIICYGDNQDYVSHGGPPGSGAAAWNSEDGRTVRIMMKTTKMYDDGNGNFKEKFSKFYFDSVLQHEMLHALMNEFMGGQQKTRWWNEGLANRFMRTENQYSKTADLARAMSGGEYLRLRDLFQQTQYPPGGRAMMLLYNQSQTIMLYMFEAGQEAMRAFLSELRDGNGDDAAVAAALGIPEEGAVEELERRWVDWMRIQLLNHLDDPNLEDAKHAKESTAAAFNPMFNELDSVELVETWDTVSTESLDKFIGVGTSIKDWSVESGVLRCDVPEEESPSLIGVRMNEVAPVAMTFDVRFRGDPDSDYAWFGVGQLSFEGDDTDVSVVAPMRDNKSHKAVCIWGDDLALYIDGTCVGRYPSFMITGNAPDVDYPLAFIAHGAFDVENIKVADIKVFSDKPLVEEEEEVRGRRGGRRRPKAPPSPGG